MKTVKIKRPKTVLVVDTDYEGYFQGFVTGLLEEKGETRFSRIVISAGPYRSYDCQYQVKGDTLYLDFYSACRNGFGNLQTHREGIKEVL